MLMRLWRKWVTCTLLAEMYSGIAAILKNSIMVSATLNICYDMTQQLHSWAF
jgi:hypothetical protein